MADGNSGSRSNGSGNGASGSTLVLNRRDFLLVGAAAATAAACSTTGESTSDFGESQLTETLNADFTFSVVRREDFLTLRFDFVNLVPDPAHLVLQRKQAGDAIIVVTFPPQHVFEATFIESDSAPATSPEAPPVGSRLSGPSRVCFTVPNTVANIPLTLTGMLQLIGQLNMSVSVNALPAGAREAVVGGTQTTPIAINPLLNTGGSLVSQVLRAQRNLFASLFFPLLKVPPPPAGSTTHVPGAAPQAPFSQETSIEIPFRLLMSPDINGAWAHAAVPVTGPSGQTELWHTRLGVRQSDGGVDEVDPTLRRMRALFSRDPSFPNFNPAPPHPPACPVADLVFSPSTTCPPPPLGELDSMTSVDRAEIVHMTSNFEFYTGGAPGDGAEPLPTPVQTNRLMLTAMGGWLDLKGQWSNDTVNGSGFDLLEWQHRTTFGRDNYIKLVHDGVLYPFGHRAVAIQVTERKLETFGTPSTTTAFLRTRIFILVKEPQKLYSAGRHDADADVHSLRKNPFIALAVKTLITPTLDVTAIPEAFVPRINGTLTGSGFTGGIPFRFAFDGLDLDGNIVHFTAPVVWVRRTGTTPPDFDLAKRTYIDENQLASADRIVDLGGQRLAYAVSNQPDDTTHETKNITFLGELATDAAYVTAGFVPTLTQATMALAALRHIAGANDVTRSYVFDDAYTLNGFGSGNAGEVLLSLAARAAGAPASDPLQVPIPITTGSQSDRSGGFVNPDLAVCGVSRRTGPVSGTDTTNVAADKFDPASFFPPSAKIFGVIPIANLLRATGLDRAPKFFTNILTRALGVIADVQKLRDDLFNLIDTDSLQPIPSIDALTGDIKKAFDLNDAGHVAAAGRIAGDVNAVVSNLANVANVLNNPPGGAQINPKALAQDLILRAQSLASLLPSIVSDISAQIAALTTGIEFPKEIHTRLEWKAHVQRDALKIFVPNHTNNTLDSSDTTGADSLYLVVDIRAGADNGGSATTDVTCTLEDFSLYLTSQTDPLIRLNFDNIQFRIKNGQKPDISVDLVGIEFGGALTFVEKIKELIPLKGFSDPPNIQVNPSGITASFTLAIPNIAVGVFSLENINLGAALNIPFIGSAPSFSFNFSTRENPFNLTVALLGGGGFFGITVTPEGIQLLEASLEAGARISINLGVASGSVSASLGIYYKMDFSTKDSSLTGYFHLHGQLDVLGIVSVSVDMSLNLTWDMTLKKVTGRATIEVEIDVLFFSASVSVSCERRFAGSSSDPTFFELMHPDGTFRPWDDYVAAFAA